MGCSGWVAYPVEEGQRGAVVLFGLSERSPDTGTEPCGVVCEREKNRHAGLRSESDRARVRCEGVVMTAGKARQVAQLLQGQRRRIGRARKISSGRCQQPLCLFDAAGGAQCDGQPDRCPRDTPGVTECRKPE